MISVCCCVINGRYDVEFMVEFLAQHNKPDEYEVCVCHDDRVNDGSAEHLAKLQAKHPNLRIIRNTKEQTVEYLTKVLDFYDKERLFDPAFMAGLRQNLQSYIDDTFFPPTRAFLWLSSGYLYNKAASIATGDVLVITPGDFVHMFRMRDLQTFVQNHAYNGHFYSKPNAIWARVSNQDPTWLREHVKAVHDGLQLREDFRWDSNQLYRDYLRCPCDLSDYWLADFRRNELVNMRDPGDFEKFYDFNRRAHAPNSGVQAGKGFHGFHIMTKKSFDAIGGFTEVFYSRAFPDDQMSMFGRQHFGYFDMPAEFSVGWIGMHECLTGVGPPLPDNWRELLRERDPLMDEHPIAGVNYGHVHLHQGLTILDHGGHPISHPNHVHIEIVGRLKRFTKPIRIGTGG